MSIYIKLQDQLIALEMVSFDYNSQRRTHKVLVKGSGERQLRLVATEKEPIKLGVFRALRGTILNAIQNNVSHIDITPQIAQAEQLYNPKDIQGYRNTLLNQPRPSSQRKTNTSVAPTTITPNEKPIIIVNETGSRFETGITVHVLKGKMGVKVNQYNISSTGNIFTINLSSKNLSESENNSLPVLKFEVHPKEMNYLAYKYKSLDGVRRIFDKKVKQATLDLMNDLPHTGILTPQYLLTYYQTVLPQFIGQEVVSTKQGQ